MLSGYDISKRVTFNCFVMKQKKKIQFSWKPILKISKDIKRTTSKQLF